VTSFLFGSHQGRHPICSHAPYDAIPSTEDGIHQAIFEADNRMPDNGYYVNLLWYSELGHVWINPIRSYFQVSMTNGMSKSTVAFTHDHIYAPGGGAEGIDGSTPETRFRTGQNVPGPSVPPYPGYKFKSPCPPSRSIFLTSTPITHNRRIL